MIYTKAFISKTALIIAFSLSVATLTCQADPNDLIDPWMTEPGGPTGYSFGSGPDAPAIPADFFGPGSDPFIGNVCLEGVPLGPTIFGEYGIADTLILRSADPFDRCDLPSPTERTVDIEIVELSLKSCAPIEVTYGGGSPQLWDVDVDLSSIPAPPGTLTATKTHCNGGTYSSELKVQPRFTFTKISDPNDTEILDTGIEGLPLRDITDPGPSPWVHGHPESGTTCDGDNFVPGHDDPLLLEEGDGSYTHKLTPVDLHDEPHWLLYVSDHDEPGNWDIYIIDVDDTSGLGGRPAHRRLTTDPGIDNHPNLSPDGTKVVWSSTRVTGTNLDGDFEIFIADHSDVTTLETGSVTQLTSNDYSDRHPHFKHDHHDLRIIYTAKYICVETKETTYVSECSIPRPVITIDPCGRKCEGMRIMDAVDLDADQNGDNRTDIDHAMLTSINPVLWPSRAPDDSRWVGHPSFSHDDTKLLFSGAVDGQGRNWEVYLLDWDGMTQTGSNLRKVTDESLYPDNPNPIKMTAGAHFSEDDCSILFTSTRTEFGNSQLFEVPSTAENVPVSPAIRHPFELDMANFYVPDPLEDGRIVLVSDLEIYTGMDSCYTQPSPQVVAVDPGSTHVIKIQASGILSPSNLDPDPASVIIHLDVFAFNGSPVEATLGSATYIGTWDFPSAPTASEGHYADSPGDSNDYIEILVPIDTNFVDLHFGRTPFSGVAQIFVDGTPITDGDVTLPGDIGPDMSGVDLYTPFSSTSNDLDLVLIDPDSGSLENVTDNDDADEMLLIGDEVSWFCGLSPNVSECTYLPKTVTIGQLRLIVESNSFLQPNYPSRALYHLETQALNQFYFSNGNTLRPNNQFYWESILFKMDDLMGAFDDELIVIPLPPNFSINNQAPTVPVNPDVIVIEDPLLGRLITIQTDSSVDTDSPNPLTYDVYLGRPGGPLLNVESDSSWPCAANLENLPLGPYNWRVVAKDDHGGLKYSPVWSFCNECSPSDFDCGVDVTLTDYSIFTNAYLSTPSSGNWNPACDIAVPADNVIDLADFSVFVSDFLIQCGGEFSL